MNVKEALKILGGATPMFRIPVFAEDRARSWEEHERLLAKVREHVIRNKIFLAEFVELVDDLKAELYCERSW